MIKVLEGELHRLAQMSQLKLTPTEITPLTNQIEQVLTYAHSVAQLEEHLHKSHMHAINVFREDVTLSCSSDMLQSAPSVANNYYVVPSILENV